MAEEDKVSNIGGKKPGDPIRSADWNALVDEIESKLGKDGGRIDGPLTVNASGEGPTESDGSPTLQNGQRDTFKIEADGTIHIGNNIQSTPFVYFNDDLSFTDRGDGAITLTYDNPNDESGPKELRTQHGGSDEYGLMRGNFEGYFLSPAILGQIISFYEKTLGIGVQDSAMYFRTSGDFYWYHGGVHANGRGEAGVKNEKNEEGTYVSKPGEMLMSLDDTGNLTIKGETATKEGGGQWTTSSDIRLKQKVQPLASALDRILGLRGVTYEWKEPEKHGNLTGPQMGMIADEVEEVFPEWVSADAQGYKLLTLRGFEALTVESLRTLKEENDRLQSRVDLLEERLARLEAHLETLPGIPAVNGNGTAAHI